MTVWWCGRVSNTPVVVTRLDRVTQYSPSPIIDAAGYWIPALRFAAAGMTEAEMQVLLFDSVVSASPVFTLPAVLRFLRIEF